MPFATPLVPMPRWSTPVGCTKFFLTIVVLAFVAACAVIWGSYPAFSISLFTASLSLFAFGYYMVALSFKPGLYNKLLILSLETTLTLFWFVSLILLAGWTGASTGIPQYYYNLSPYPSSYGTTIDLSGRDVYRRNTTFSVGQRNRLCERQELDIPQTVVRHHGMDARYAAQVLAGIAAGLAGMIFILYGTTTATFATNIHLTPSGSEPTIPSPTILDEEAQVMSQARPLAQDQPRLGSHPSPLRSHTTHMINPQVIPNAAVAHTYSSPPLMEPLRIETLPKDFELQPQKQMYYSTTGEASEAGIEPPTPVLRAMAAAKKADGLVFDEPVSPVEVEKEQRRGSTPVREDGRLEREV